MTLPPPGWYHDPEGSDAERWFDGSEWTTFKRKPIASIVGSPEALPSDEAPETPQPPAGPAPAEPVARDQLPEWDQAVAYWRAIIDALPLNPTVKRGMFSAAPKGYAAHELQERELTEIVQGWGRPAWWLPEPRTGGLTCGWNTSGPSQFAMHVQHDGRCDNVFVRKPGELELAWRMRRLGNMIGKPATQIEQAVGLPTSRSSIGRGVTLLQWHANGYHIALKFDSDMYCLGVTSQHAHRPI